jgi:membrane associated rhomboid family serine protease
MARTPAINLPPAVVWLAAIFIGVHLVRQIAGRDVDEWIVVAFAFVPARYSEAGLLLPGGVTALVWSPITYAFLHADFLHLLINIVWMASFGSALARRFGAARFLLLSAVSAAAGAGATYAIHPGEETIVIGASGAVSGMMAATARFAFSPGGPLAVRGTAASYRVPAPPLVSALGNGRALGFILVWFGINLLFGLTGGLIPGVSGPIAWEAHLGGFLAGLLCFDLLDPAARSPSERPAP